MPSENYPEQTEREIALEVEGYMRWQREQDKWFQLAMLAKGTANPRDFTGPETIALALDEAARLFPIQDGAPLSFQDPATAVANFIDALREALETFGFMPAAQAALTMTEADLEQHNGEIPL